MLPLFLLLFSVFNVGASLEYRVVSVEENVPFSNRLTDNPAAVCVTLHEYNAAEVLLKIKKYYGYCEPLTYKQETVFDSIKYYVMRGVGLMPRVVAYQELPECVQQAVPELADGSFWIVATEWSSSACSQSDTDDRFDEPKKAVPVVVEQAPSVFELSTAEQMVIALP